MKQLQLLKTYLKQDIVGLTELSPCKGNPQQQMLKTTRNSSKGFACLAYQSVI